MTSAAVAVSPVAPVYGSAVADYEDAFERARRAVREEQEALDAHRAAIDARDAAVLAAYKLAPEEWSDNAVARSLGMNASTMRSIVPRSERRSGRRGQE